MGKKPETSPRSWTTRQGQPRRKRSRTGWVRETVDTVQAFSRSTSVRYVSPPPTGVKLADHLDDFGEPEISEKIRLGILPLTSEHYWENSRGEFVEREFPDQIFDFVASRADPRVQLRTTIEDSWLPRTWKHFAAAGFGGGHLVWVWTQQKEWQPEIREGTAPIGDACPAWRLPWAERFREGDAFWIAGELLQAVCLIQEVIDPTFPRLRERFSQLEGEPLLTPDLTALGLIAADRFHALLEFEYPPGDHHTIGERVNTAQALSVNKGRLTDWKQKLAPALKVEIEAGRIVTLGDAVAFAMRGGLHKDKRTIQRGIRQIEAVGLIPQLR